MYMYIEVLLLVYKNHLLCIAVFTNRPTRPEPRGGIFQGAAKSRIKKITSKWYDKPRVDQVQCASEKHQYTVDLCIEVLLLI